MDRSPRDFIFPKAEGASLFLELHHPSKASQVRPDLRPLATTLESLQWKYFKIQIRVNTMFFLQQVLYNAQWGWFMHQPI